MAKHEFSCETADCYVCTELFMTGQMYYTPGLLPKLPAYTHISDAIYLCPQCNKLHGRGYLALVEIDIAKSNVPEKINGVKLKEGGVVRTGRRIHVRRADAAVIFKMPELLDDERCVAYVREGFIDELVNHPGCRFRDESNDDDD